MKQYEGKTVWCKTEVLANEFLSKAHEAGYKWGSGVNLLDESYWEVRKGDTCYYIYKDKEVQCSSKIIAEFNGYKIVEYKGKRNEE